MKPKKCPICGKPMRDQDCARCFNFTKPTLLSLPVPASGRAVYNDTQCRGLKLRITETGHKSYCLEVRDKITNQKKRITIGDFDAVTIKQARDAADEIRQPIKAGAPTPQEERRRRRDSDDPFGASVEHVLELYIAEKQKKKLKPMRESTAADYRQCLKAVLGTRMQKPLMDMNTNTIRLDYNRWAKRSEARAKAYVRGIRPLFNFWLGLHNDVLGMRANPVRGLVGDEKQPMRPKISRLDDDQIKPWWAAVEALPKSAKRTTAQYEPIAQILKFLLLTGTRANEACYLTWDNVDLKGKKFTVTAEDAKNHEQVELPLCAYLVNMLKRIPNKEGLVFPTSHGTPVNDFGGALEIITTACGFRRTRHDLRRTFARVVESQDVSWIAGKRLMNHKVSDITAQYAYDGTLTAPMVSASQKVTNHILIKAGVMKAPKKKAKR